MAKKKNIKKIKNINLEKIKETQTPKIPTPWFRKRNGIFSKDIGYGWIPITWQGYILLIIFLAINFFSVFYFDIPKGNLDSILSFFVVLFLSIFIFIVIATKKTNNYNIQH
ncbi:MAG: hypothetical protein WC548_00200 [Candidatus Pacearchaeota archaeon]